MNKIPSTTGTEKEDAISPATVGLCYQKPWAHSSLFYSPPFSDTRAGEGKEAGRHNDFVVLGKLQRVSVGDPLFL